MKRFAALALTLALTLTLALPALAQKPGLTTLCIGLPECEPGYPLASQPGQATQDPLGPANAALMAEDWAGARALLAPLAQAGNPEGAYKLADLFYKGRGGPVDYLAAGKWYSRAAEALGTDWAHEAQYNLGLMHAAGQGLSSGPDLAGALTWLTIAEASGSDLAPETARLVAAKLTPEQAEKARAEASTWLAKRGQQGQQGK